MNKIKYFFLFFLFLSSTAFALAVFSQYFSQSLSITTLFYLLGKLAGLLGFLFLSTLIISGDTARFFDSYVGMDKIIKFQRKYSIFTSLFVLAHPIFFILSDQAFLPFLLPDFTAFPVAMGTLALYFFLFVMAASILYKRISYEAWQYLHILTYVLFLFSLYHAANIGSDIGHPLVQSIFFILFIGIITGIIYRTRYKIKQRENKFIVENMAWETSDTFTVTVKPTKKFVFEAGQFCFIRIKKEKLYARHPFTISSSPHEDTIQFTIKIQGRFTRAASQLTKGEEIMVEGPFGIFTLQKTPKNIVFIAGGVGVTPFMSMLRYRLQANHDQKQEITLLYCSKNKKEKIFRKELDSIQKEWFKKVYVLSRDEKAAKEDEKGYLDKTMIQKYVSRPDQSLFYICGPEGLKNSVMKSLLEMGVKKQNIHIEDFFW